jgi:hypothetical protein
VGAPVEVPHSKIAHNTIYSFTSAINTIDIRSKLQRM